MIRHRLCILVPVVAIAIWLGTIAVYSTNEARVYHDTLAARTKPVTDRPIEVQEDGYVSSRTCKACHPDEYAS